MIKEFAICSYNYFFYLELFYVMFLQLIQEMSDCCKRGWVLMKLSTLSGTSLVSSTHDPGLGSGTLLLATGSQAEVLLSCSLNFPLLAIAPDPGSSVVYNKGFLLQ